MARSGRRSLLIILNLLLALGAIAAYQVYGWIQGSNVSPRADNELLYIPTGSSLQEVVDLLSQDSFLISKSSFLRVAAWMKYDDQAVKPGRYRLRSGWSNRTLVGRLRSGDQAPVNVVINHVRDLGQLAGKISRNLEVDSTTLAAVLYGEAAWEGTTYDEATRLSAFIPNTYEMFWNASPEQIVTRLHRETERFWDQDDRRKKAQDLGLSPQEVYTLASIVERETQKTSERPTVAGLYLNRLKRGIPLQADPTVVFAVGDFTLRRVLNKHLAIDSPYNTYRVPGLPPGPIYMPSLSSIDAVLEAEDHNYLYMCAKPGSIGEHVFASNLAEHGINANRYRRWLNQQGIR